ncbi:MAG: hypothetical protein Q9202_006946 [Teloschistes flavicans]
MQTIWTLIPSFLYIILADAATLLPHTPLSLFPPATTNNNPTAPFLIATRQLLTHDCTLTLRYYPTLPLTPRTYNNILAASLLRISANIVEHGDDTPLTDTFRQRIGDVVLRAGQVEGSPEALMTWGILEEGVEVLRGFMQGGRGCVVEGEVREGLVGKGGVPVGMLGVGFVEGMDGVLTRRV